MHAHAHFNMSAREIGAILDSLLLLLLLVKCARKSVKRLEIIPIKREATWNRLFAILDTHGVLDQNCLQVQYVDSYHGYHICHRMFFFGDAVG